MISDTIFMEQLNNYYAVWQINDSTAFFVELFLAAGGKEQQ